MEKKGGVGGEVLGLGRRKKEQAVFELTKVAISAAT